MLEYNLSFWSSNLKYWMWKTLWMMESKIKDLGMKDVLNVLQNEAKTNLGVKDVLVQSPELYKGIHRQANSIWFSSKKSINWLTSQILLCGNNALSGLGFSSISKRDVLPEFEIKYWHILQLIQRQNKNLTKHLTHWEFCNRSERCTSGVQNKTRTLHVIGCWFSSKQKLSHGKTEPGTKVWLPCNGWPIEEPEV